MSDMELGQVEPIEELVALGEAMRKLGIEIIQTKYHGGGDEGGPEESYCSAAEDASDEVRQKCDDGTIESERINDKVLGDLIFDAWDAAISAAGHDGFGNDAGGRGECTFNNDGSAYLEHVDYYTAPTESAYTVSGPPTESMTELKEFMQQRGTASIKLEYGNYGPCRAVCWDLSGNEVEGAKTADDAWELLKSAWDDVIKQCGHESYHQEEGGFGVCTFSITEIQLDHTDLFLEEDSSQFQISADGTVVPVGIDQEVEEIAVGPAMSAG